METRLIYNSTEKLYEVRLGLRTLSSHDTKTQALVMQLTNEAPNSMELAQKLIETHPELEGRAIKAVILVAQRAVKATEHPARFEVRGQGKQGSKPSETYQVDVEASTCTCLDWERNAPEINSRKLCKHVLAALFVRRLGASACRQPTKSERLCHEKRW